MFVCTRFMGTLLKHRALPRAVQVTLCLSFVETPVGVKATHGRLRELQEGAVGLGLEEAARVGAERRAPQRGWAPAGFGKVGGMDTGVRKTCCLLRPPAPGGFF